MNNTYTPDELKFYLKNGYWERDRPNATKSKMVAPEGLFIDEIYKELLDKVEVKTAIFIPGNIPSSKNSREIMQIYTGKSNCCRKPYVKIGKGEYLCTGCNKPCQLGRRPILGYSKVCKKFMDDSVDDFENNAETYLSWGVPYPHNVGMYFIRNSRRHFDGINAAQIIFDQFTKYGWAEDDDMDYLRYHDIGYHVGPNPGVIITLLDFTPKFKIFSKIQKV